MDFSDAYDILGVLIHEKDPISRGTIITGWLTDCERRLETGEPLSLADVNALFFILKNDIFDRFDVAESRCRQILRRAKGRLLNRSLADDELLARLPNSILRKHSREEVLFHQAIHHGDRTGFWGSIKTVVGDYIFKPQDVLFALFFLLLFATLVALGGEVVSGLVLGYAFSSFMEYLVHRYIAHATPKIRAVLKRFGKVGQDMLRFAVEHSVHHASVKENYCEPFAPGDLSSVTWKDEQAKAREKADTFILRIGGESLLEMVRQSRYGLGSSNARRTLLFFLPLSLLAACAGIGVSRAFGLGWGLPFVIAFLLISEFWIFVSATYHPLLHRSHTSLVQQENVLIRKIMFSRLSRFIARSHRMHHATAGRLNQNLNPGADFFFGYISPSLRELYAMRMQEIPF